MKTTFFTSKRWLIASMLVLLLCFGMVGTVQAVEIDRDGKLAAGEVVDDDLVLTGTVVTVDGTVNGTLVAAGRTITLNGLIKSDAILAGETIIIGEKAVIEGNLFVAGSEVVMRGKLLGSLFGGSATFTLAESSSIGRNLYYGGYQFETKTGTKVGKDINVAGYQHILNGDCRNLSLAGVAVDLNGAVSGNATIYLGEQSNDYRSFRPTVNNWQLPPAMPAGLRIGGSAKVAGKLTYTSSLEQSRNFAVTPAGGTVYNTPVPYEREHDRTQGYYWRNVAEPLGLGFWVWDLLRNLATILILGALVFWLVPGLFQKSLEQVKAHSLGSIGIGFLAVALSFVVVPFAILVVFLVGLLLAVTTLFDLSGMVFTVGFTAVTVACIVFTIVLFWAGKLLVSFIMGQWLISKMVPSAAGSRLWSFVTGAVIFALLAAIPIFGFLFSFVAALAGLGVMWYVWRNRKATANPVVVAAGE